VIRFLGSNVVVGVVIFALAAGSLTLVQVAELTGWHQAAVVGGPGRWVAAGLTALSLVLIAARFLYVASVF